MVVVDSDIISFVGNAVVVVIVVVVVMVTMVKLVVLIRCGLW